MRVERWLYTIPLRLRSLFRGDRVEQELDDELRDHIARLTDAYVAQGLTPEEARYAALRAMDGVDQRKEQCRDTRRLNLLDDLVKDFRYALRVLRRAPGFTAAAIVSLALGIGANTAIFSVVDAVLLRPLAYRQPERLVVVGQGGGASIASARTFLEWRARSRSFERVGAAEYWTPNLTGPDRTEQLYALHLSADVLPLLGIEPVAGRAFGPDEEHLGREHVVVIGHALWKNRFAADPGIVGRTISLDGEPYTIVGVMPASFQFAPFWATRAQLWAPLVLDNRTNDTGASLRVFARLKPGMTLPQARAEMASIAVALEARTPDLGPQASVTPLHTMVVGDVRSSLLILFAAAVLVLLIACANVAHLQLVRAASREREIAVRSALGASRARVIRQLLTESALLSAAGAGAGALLAYGGVRLLVSLAPPGVPRISTVTMDATAFAFMLLATVLSGLFFGIAPALKGSRVDLNDSLKEGRRGSTDGGGRNGARSVLVISEVAMAMVLLVSAGLTLRSFFGLLAVDSGFDPRNLVSMEVSVAGTSEAAPSKRPEFFRALLDRVRAIPGVEAASAINHAPLVGDVWTFDFAVFSVGGRPLLRPDQRPNGVFRVVLPGYFQTMRIPLLKGRDVTDRDVLDAPHVVIINDFMARRHFPGDDPIGQRIAAGNLTTPDWCTVVGVVRNAKRSNWSEPDAEEMYFPYLQTRLYLENPRSFATYLTLVARTSLNPAGLIAAADTLARTMNHDVVVTNAITMERAIAGEFAAPRFYLLLLGVFAGVALVLAAVGIYGVISHTVARRTHEIGVRMALGAGRGAILRLVVAHGMRLAIAGCALGLAGAIGVTRYLRALLFGVEPIDPVTFGLVAVMLGAVALIACYVPARRALAVDPTTAMRCE